MNAPGLGIGDIGATNARFALIEPRWFPLFAETRARLRNPRKPGLVILGDHTSLKGVFSRDLRLMKRDVWRSRLRS